ncbi:GNAT family N-acetyltransferase [Parabacteroides sp. 52]|uniref:GNAT family N-acetyltransferase n=1 Tax=unclassified Parabacteroides TaxID=2649774 RepID=UPI0013D4F20B|nr:MULTISPECIES: GNAT family N-acetyltransferase [unclassified Parabacteroides]MDH6534935.1 ribosomal protein S18 acetylase RimI-like enzyme [Parabacteroides sp. PM5-20]NDV55686.1 GNAT family N-acetyltransferase [Parabacteroides sp. 52]
MKRIKCIPITSATDPLLDRIEKTYTESFPEVERRAFKYVRDLIKEEPIFTVYALNKEEINAGEDTYAGFITAWDFGSFNYIEHFAIDSVARNNGMGTEAMHAFFLTCPKPIVLEVEMPSDEMSQRRIGFYERLGFVLNNHPYQQPPYRPGESWFDMLLMSYGNMNLETAFESVRDCLYTYVYQVKEEG